ncbi:MAG: STAS domain-containing protein [Gammaproteobacteria bacterium]|nr:STAS domain-containing protein [Gammaproteobacteria bacterium]
MRLCRESEKNLIVYGEMLNICEIHSQQSIYQEALNSGKPLCLQASAIHSVDTTSLQLLLSFILSAKERKISWSWQDCTPALCNAVQLLGMEHLLEIGETSHEDKRSGLQS